MTKSLLRRHNPTRAAVTRTNTGFVYHLRMYTKIHHYYKAESIKTYSKIFTICTD